MKFGLVLRKLLKILLVQEIREPNHAHHVIDHLDCVKSNGSHILKAKPKHASFSELMIKPGTLLLFVCIIFCPLILYLVI